MKAINELNLPDDVKYTDDHEWAKTSGDVIRIGISDYAQDQLGDIVFVELPEVGATFARGESFGVVESVKAVSDLFAPIGGEVVGVNEELVDRPEAVNEACYGEGWMVAFAPTDESELDALLDADAYRQHVDDRSD